MSESPKWEWGVYYKNVPQNLSKDTLLKALQLTEKENDDNLQMTAIDIGCGHGPDTIELLYG